MGSPKIADSNISYYIKKTLLLKLWVREIFFMTFSILLLGVLIILVAFNVGESIYVKLNIKKKWLLIFLIGTLVLYFIPNLKINGITFTWIGFFLPLIFSVIVLFQVKKAKAYFKMFVAVLIAFSLDMIYNLITFDVYESAVFQPYIVLGLILGSVSMALAQTPTRLYASNFLGLIFAEIVFYVSRYSIYGEYYLTLGSRKVFETLLVAFVTSLFVYFLARKVKAIKIRRKLAKNKTAEV